MALRAARQERGLSQEALAERAELLRTYVADVEGGRRNLTLCNQARLAVALEISLGELMELTERHPGEAKAPAKR